MGAWRQLCQPLRFTTGKATPNGGAAIRGEHHGGAIGRGPCNSILLECRLGFAHVCRDRVRRGRSCRCPLECGCAWGVQLGLARKPDRSCLVYILDHTSPTMSATSSHAFPLATETSIPDDTLGGDAAGASGSAKGALEITQGGMIAIIVIVSVVAILGIASSVLFYLAKKKEWKVRETIRKSAKRVVTALTPRRSEFPKSAKESRSGRVRLDDVPPTPRLRPEDLEKGLAPPAPRQGSPPRGKHSNFSRK
ncbi:hypothetical protein RB595_003103 [Gaeumannomyces hyphopodioides]